VKKVIVSLLIASFFLAGCFSKNGNIVNEQTQSEMNKHIDGYAFPTEKELNAMKDNKLNDPALIENDELLRVGDTGLDKMIKEVQNPPSNFDLKMMKKVGNVNKDYKPMNVHHTWQSPEIHQVFVNPKVKPINGDYVNNVVGKAWDYYGTPYEYGSDRNTDVTFDCSDFVRWVHLWTVGMDLPKTSASQYEYVKKFSKRHYTDLNQAKRGDVLFFMSYKGWKPEDYKGINVKAQPVAHNGIYVGNGILLHTASQKTGGVRFDTIKGSHLEYRFIGGGNIIQ